MKTINITVTLTDTEYDFLKLGKCDIPSPQRLKMMLLREAARNLRNMSESVLQSAREPQARKGFAETVIDEGKRRARDERKAVSAVLTKSKLGRKPNPTDGSAQPDWLDDDNIDKLRQ